MPFLTQAQQAVGSNQAGNRQYGMRGGGGVPGGAPALSLASMAQAAYSKQFGGLPAQSALEARTAQTDSAPVFGQAAAQSPLYSNEDPRAKGMSPAAAGVAEATIPGFHTGATEPGVARTEQGLAATPTPRVGPTPQQGAPVAVPMQRAGQAAPAPTPPKSGYGPPGVAPGKGGVRPPMGAPSIAPFERSVTGYPTTVQPPAGGVTPPRTFTTPGVQVPTPPLDQGPAQGVPAPGRFTPPGYRVPTPPQDQATAQGDGTAGKAPAVPTPQAPVTGDGLTRPTTAATTETPQQIGADWTKVGTMYEGGPTLYRDKNGKEWIVNANGVIEPNGMAQATTSATETSPDAQDATPAPGEMPDGATEQPGAGWTLPDGTPYNGQVFEWGGSKWDNPKPANWGQWDRARRQQFIEKHGLTAAAGGQQPPGAGTEEEAKQGTIEDISFDARARTGRIIPGENGGFVSNNFGGPIYSWNAGGGNGHVANWSVIPSNDPRIANEFIKYGERFWQQFWNDGMNLRPEIKKDAKRLEDPETVRRFKDEDGNDGVRWIGDPTPDFLFNVGHQMGAGVQSLFTVGGHLADRLENAIASHDQSKITNTTNELGKIMLALERYGIQWVPSFFQQNPGYHLPVEYRYGEYGLYPGQSVAPPGGGGGGGSGGGGGGGSPYNPADPSGFPLTTEFAGNPAFISDFAKNLTKNPEGMAAAEFMASLIAQERGWNAQKQAWLEGKDWQQEIADNPQMALAEQLAMQIGQNPNPVDFESIKNREAGDIAQALANSQQQLGASAGRRGLDMGAVQGMSSQLARESGETTARRMGELETQSQIMNRQGQMEGINALSGVAGQRLQAQQAAASALEQILMGAAPTQNPIGGATDLALALNYRDLAEGQMDDQNDLAESAAKSGKIKMYADIFMSLMGKPSTGAAGGGAK